jgi:hypothetical protein
MQQAASIGLLLCWSKHHLLLLTPIPPPNPIKQADH